MQTYTVEVGKWRIWKCWDEMISTTNLTTHKLFLSKKHSENVARYTQKKGMFQSRPFFVLNHINDLISLALLLQQETQDNSILNDIWDIFVSNILWYGIKDSFPGWKALHAYQQTTKESIMRLCTCMAFELWDQLQVKLEGRLADIRCKNWTKL